MADDERRVVGSEYDSKADSKADSEYSPYEETEESDVYTSDSRGYSSEKSNDEFMDGLRKKKELQLQEYAAGCRSKYANSDTNIRNIYKGERFDPRCPIEKIKFQVGMRFESPSQFRTAVKNYAISNGYNIRLVRSGEQKVEVVCKGDCPWRIYASWGRMQEAFVVKTLIDNHSCSRAATNRQADYKWIANYFLEKIRVNMHWKVVDMMQELNEKFGITVSKDTCYRARSAARRKLLGSSYNCYHLFLKKKPGKPKQMIKVDIQVNEHGTQKLSRRGMLMRCSLCHQFGHNRKSCARKTLQAAGQELSRVEVYDAHQPMIECIQQPSQPFPTPTPIETGQTSSDSIKNLQKSRSKLMVRKKQVERNIDVQMHEGKSKVQEGYRVITGASGKIYACIPAEPIRMSYMGEYGVQSLTPEQGGQEQQQQFGLHPQHEHTNSGDRKGEDRQEQPAVSGERLDAVSALQEATTGNEKDS